MKKRIIKAAALLFIGVTIGYVIGRQGAAAEQEQQAAHIHEPTTVLSSWDILTLAIIETESQYDSMAIGRDGKDRGVLQLRPIYITDANRIIGIETYSEYDAFSVQKSIEMFNIIQDHYNPQHDIERAITLHNPRGGNYYHTKVMRNYSKWEQISEIINLL